MDDFFDGFLELLQANRTTDGSEQLHAAAAARLTRQFQSLSSSLWITD